MMLVDFKCVDCANVTEHFVKSNTTTIPCGCGGSANRIISGTSFRLDGTDPAYPTAYDKWARQHEKAGGQTD